jgi:phage FluMu protein Com
VDPLLDRLAEDLIALGWDRVLHQVKQKFGGLRFYIGGRVVLDFHGGDKLQSIEVTTRKGAYEALAHRIAEAEKESLKICEECGAPGRPCRPGCDDDRGWIETRCPRCFAREDAEVRAQRSAEDAEEAEWQALENAQPDRLRRPLRPNEIQAAHAARRCGVCGRDLLNETWVAETGATFAREGRCPRCGPLKEQLS